jgi:hypothetical protein
MFKRAIPFILTFVIGLLIASFFVNIIPSFKFGRGYRKGCRHQHEFRYQNDRVQTENEQMKREMMRIEEDLDVPPMPSAPKRVN